MARNHKLEDLLRHDFQSAGPLTEKTMFGGVAWMLGGHLLCGAREDGMLVRLGKGRDGWALEIPDVAPMFMRDRPMQGWVRAGPQAYGDDALRRKLIEAAIAFVRTLPPK